MIRLFFVLIMVISASSAVIFNYYQLNQTMIKNSQIDSDRNRLNEIKNLLIKSAVIHNGTILLPFNANAEIPNFISVNKNNVFGIPYTYCPYSTLQGSYTSQVNTLNGSYQVSLLNNALTNSNDYVLTSENSPLSGVLGIIISNHLNSNKVDCNEVSVVNDNIVAPNALVSVIHTNNIIYNDLIRNDFARVNTREELEQEAFYFNGLSPDLKIVEINGSMNINSLSFLNNKAKKSNLHILSGETPFTLTNATQGTITFSNLNITIENANLVNMKMIFRNSNVVIKNSTINHIESFNSNINFSNVSFDKTFNSDFYNTTLTFEEGIYNSNFSGSANSPFNLFNSTIQGTGLTFNSNSSIPLSYLFFVDSASSMALYSSVINANHTGSSVIVSAGKTVFRNTILSANSGINSGIYLNEKGSFNANNSSIGTSSGRPLIAIRDEGGLSISGIINNNLYGVNDCVLGALFTDTVNVDYEDTIAVSANTETGAITNNVSNKVASFSIKDRFNDFNYTCY